MGMWFWGFTEDMEIRRERGKGGRRGGRFPVGDLHRAGRELTWGETGGVVAGEKIPKPPTVVTTRGRCGQAELLAISKNARCEALVDVRGTGCELRGGCGYG